ncbi:MAG: ATP-binding cassette domain-containing protein [Spirochaetales bacterium]|nr:ATP-binding cassette domain-containing protein [Spirochaetales bacterium]
MKFSRDDFNFCMKAQYEKDITAIFGPSGAGKTTLIKLLAGLLKPDSGKIILNDQVLTDVENGICLPPEKRSMGIVFQEKLLFPHMTVKQNLCFGVRYAKRSTVKLDEIIEVLGLSKLLNSYPCNISGGEQQRTAIGRALMCSPQLLLLDEPFNAVDYTLRSEILVYLKRCKVIFNIPMIVISHDPEDLKKLTDTVQLIDNGHSGGYGNIYEFTRERVINN